MWIIYDFIGNKLKSCRNVESRKLDKKILFANWKLLDDLLHVYGDITIKMNKIKDSAEIKTVIWFSANSKEQIFRMAIWITIMDRTVHRVFKYLYVNSSTCRSIPNQDAPSCYKIHRTSVWCSCNYGPLLKQTLFMLINLPLLKLPIIEISEFRNIWRTIVYRWYRR